MKRMVVLVLAMVAAVVVFIAMPVMWKEERSAYDRELVQHFANALSGEGVRAVYDGVETRLSVGNTERLRPVLCRTEREYVNHERDYTGECVELYVDDEMTLIVEAPDPMVDCVYIYYNCAGKQRTLMIEGYRTMYWVTSMVVPDGMYGENTVISA